MAREDRYVRYVRLRDGIIIMLRLKKVLGPTHSRLIASQFARLRRGDRFFYEDNSDPNVAFSLVELLQIRKVTFAHILCNNLARTSDQKLRKLNRRDFTSLFSKLFLLSRCTSSCLSARK